MLFTEEMDLQVHNRFLERRGRLKSCMAHAAMQESSLANSCALTGFPSDGYLERLDADVRTALEFLYAWMPVSDVMMYPAETYLDFARRHQCREGCDSVSQLFCFPSCSLLFLLYDFKTANSERRFCFFRLKYKYILIPQAIGKAHAWLFE